MCRRHLRLVLLAAVGVAVDATNAIADEHGHRRHGHQHSERLKKLELLERPPAVGDGDLDHDHDTNVPAALTAAVWESTVKKERHVWAVKFFDPMCSACEEFAPSFDGARALVPGLHWATFSIGAGPSQQANVLLATKLGILEEGLPNVKLVNAATTGALTAVVTGETPSTDVFAKQLKAALASTGAELDGGGFYKSPRVEL